MEIDQVRKDMIARFKDLEPELSPEVLDDATYRSVYKTPFRARNMRALTKYEEKHEYQFCKACMGHDDRTDKVIAYRAYVTEDDNLLENKRDAWIRMQCFHCNFDLRFDKPAPQNPSLDLDRMRQAIEAMQQQGMPPSAQQQYIDRMSRQVAQDVDRGIMDNYGQGLMGGYGQGIGGQSAAEVEYMQRERNEMLRRQVEMTSMPPVREDMLDALRYSQVLDPSKFGEVLPHNIHVKKKK